MNADDKEKLLVQEYMLLQKTVEDFDARALTIKAWSVTFSAAGLGLAYQQGKPLLLLIAALSALTFWIVEAVWKLHQHAFYPRIETLEAWFAGESPDAPAPLQISRAWTRACCRSIWYFARVPFILGVMLPHAVVAAAGLLLYLFWPPG